MPDPHRVAERIVDQLTVNMRRLSIKHFEYVALKGIAFFDPRELPYASHDRYRNLQ